MLTLYRSQQARRYLLDRLRAIYFDQFAALAIMSDKRRSLLQVNLDAPFDCFRFIVVSLIQF
jgi:hypothetical protein